jgi:hypothetical protein
MPLARLTVAEPDLDRLRQPIPGHAPTSAPVSTSVRTVSSVALDEIAYPSGSSPQNPATRVLAAASSRI